MTSSPNVSGYSDNELFAVSKLYEIRDTAKRLLGDRYESRMSGIMEHIGNAVALTGKDALTIVLENTQDLEAIDRIIVIAAVVEFAEKGP